MVLLAAPSELTEAVSSVYSGGRDTLIRPVPWKERELVSDEELMIRLKEGDSAAFDLLVERYQQQAYGIAYQMVGHPEDARDLSQEAFLRIYESAQSFRGTSRFYTWFYRILVNLSLDHLRRRSLRNRLFHFFWDNSPEEDDPPDPIQKIREQHDWGNPERGAADVQFRRALRRALAELSPQQRAVFLLRNNHDLSLQEIAEILRTSEGTVKTHLFRAIRSLRQRLSDFK